MDMHIDKHKRKKPPYLRQYLRVSVKDGKKFKTRIIANLTYWNPAKIAQLENALYLKRYFAGTPIELDAVARINSLLTDFASEHDDPSLPFQALNSMVQGSR